MSRSKTDIDMTAFRAAQIVRKRMRTTREEIAEGCHLALASLTRPLGVLRDAHIIEVHPRDNSAWWRLVARANKIPVGRPRDWLTLAPELGYLIGVHVAHRQISATITRAEFGKVVEKPRRVSLRDLDESPEPALDLTATLITELLEEASSEHDITPESVIGIGLGLPGPIDRSAKTVASDMHILSTWSKHKPAKELGERLAGVLPGVTIEVENDASLGALGVHSWEALTTDPAKAPRDLVYVRVGDGIGAGVVMKGKLVGGSGGLAGEIGHVMVDERGRFCPRCGQRGCVEVKAGEGAVVADLAPSVFTAMDPADVTIEDVLARRHPACLRALYEAGWNLGIALAHARTLLDPARIYIGGPMAASEKHFMAAVAQGIGSRSLTMRVKAKDLVFPAPDIAGPRPDLGTSELLGAIAIALHRCGDAQIQSRLGAARAADK